MRRDSFNPNNYDVVLTMGHGVFVDFGESERDQLAPYFIGVELKKIPQPKGEEQGDEVWINVSRYSFRDKNGRALSVAIRVMDSSINLPCVALEGASKIHIFDSAQQLPTVSCFSIQADEIIADNGCDFRVSDKFRAGRCKVGSIVADKVVLGSSKAGRQPPVAYVWDIKTNLLSTSGDIVSEGVILAKQTEGTGMFDKGLNSSIHKGGAIVDKKIANSIKDERRTARLLANNSLRLWMENQIRYADTVANRIRENKGLNGFKAGSGQKEIPSSIVPALFTTFGDRVTTTDTGTPHSTSRSKSGGMQKK